MLEEPRPLGVVRTLAGIREAGLSGTLLLSNTDMVTEPDMKAMLRQHRETGSGWTLLCGPFPADGRYGGLSVAGDGLLGGPGAVKMHYYGISLLEPGVLEVAASLGGGDMFGGLLEACVRAGLRPRAFRTGSRWLDMGSLERLRRNILAGGSWISRNAEVAPGARIRGRVSIGDGCRVGPAATVRDSVMLAGSSMEGGDLTEGILPWDTPFESGRAVYES